MGSSILIGSGKLSMLWKPEKWEGLADRLQAKLGSHYKVTQFTVDEFNRHGRDCD